jgi:tRNA A37 threonylcarbamoyladenosine synthetase subunit TsaC/SUA5/YrdC
MPKNEIALKIIEASGGSLVGTSANLSGMLPARSVEELDPVIEEGVDLVVDGGTTELGVPSTVIEVLQVGGSGRTAKVKIRVLREGAVGIDAIKRKAQELKREGKKVDFL